MADVRIVESVDGGYYVQVKNIDETRFWTKSYCFTLWGARRVALRMRDRIARGLYMERIDWTS
jgi:hypothetical protein